MIAKLLSKGKKYDNMGMIEVGGGNMKKSKGFTLIELLAVIVILAIIALIATPIILNIINDSREKSNQRSVEGLGKAVETTIGEIMMDSDYTGSDIVCKLGSNISDSEMSKNDIDDDETYCWDIGAPEGTIKKVTYSGSRVKAGSIVFDKEIGKISIANAQVGSSSKKYSTESDDSLIVTITSLATKENEDWIFTDPYGNVRYRGLNPNNYVTFNDELWRIIGIVDGKVKLIRKESIGGYAWDYHEDTSDVGPYGQSSLMKLLNPGYNNETIGGSLYWNRSDGKCYGEYDEIITCSFTETGLTEAAKKMLDKNIWYLGKVEGYDIKATETYEKERSGNLIWYGYLALPYASDYGYAVNSQCTQNLDNYDGCENWIALQSNNESSYLINTSGTGGVAWFENYMVDAGHDAWDADQIFPAVYLKTNIKIKNLDTANGSEAYPYELAL